MSGKGSTFAYDVLRVVFNNTPRTGLFSSGTVTGYYCRLHTADPSTGVATLGEVSYTGYAPILTTRATSTGGWSVTTPTSANASVQPVSAITFGQNTSTTTGTITHFSLTTSTGADPVIYSGTVSPNINFSQNVTPIITTASSITED